MKLRIILADDEPLARRRLQDLLENEQDVEIVAVCANGHEAVEAIHSEKPDLALLDVQMPGLTGLEVAESLGSDDLPEVIFVTAYDEYALRAFDAHAIDYLMKPVSPDRLHSALERARVQAAHRRTSGADEEPRIRALLESLAKESGYPERFAVRSTSRTVFVRVDSIDWIGAEGNYARLHIARQSHLIRETMAALEQRLDPRRFLRIHRSTIVNIERIREIQNLGTRSWVVILEDGTKLESSNGYRKAIQEWIEGVA